MPADHRAPAVAQSTYGPRHRGASPIGIAAPSMKRTPPGPATTRKSPAVPRMAFVHGPTTSPSLPNCPPPSITYANPCHPSGIAIVTSTSASTVTSRYIDQLIARVDPLLGARHIDPHLNATHRPRRRVDLLAVPHALPRDDMLQATGADAGFVSLTVLVAHPARHEVGQDFKDASFLWVTPS